MEASQVVQFDRGKELTAMVCWCIFFSLSSSAKAMAASLRFPMSMLLSAHLGVLGFETSRCGDLGQGFRDYACSSKFRA